MKKIAIVVMLMAASASAQAAFVIDCQTAVNKSGTKRPHSVQWRWDGTQLRTTYREPGGDEVYKERPAHFEQRDFGAGESFIKSTVYGFVLKVTNDGLRQAQTFLAIEHKNREISIVEMLAIVSPAGALLSIDELTHRD